MNWEVPSEHQESLLSWAGAGALAQAAHRSSEDLILGDLQKPPGHPALLFLLQQGLSRIDPEVSANSTILSFYMNCLNKSVLEGKSEIRISSEKN